MNAATRINIQILEEASTWFVEVSEGPLDTGAREALNRWLRSSPEHVRAYLETAAIWEGAGLIDKDRKRTLDDLVAMAQDRPNVVQFREPAARVSTRGRRANKKWAAAASVAFVALAAGAIAWLQPGGATVYSTGVGEQHSITLADGSTVILNSSSRIRVRFDATRRDIELRQGQALFEVAKDSSRPFVVSSGQTRVTAVGTQFDVNKRSRVTVVTVLEGRVAVAASKASLSYISAGERISVTPQAVSRPVRADVAAATAWTSRRLVFSSTPLEQVVEEYNRYHSRPLRIRDHGLDGFNISGTFSSADASSLVDFLRAQPGIELRDTGPAIEIDAR